MNTIRYAGKRSARYTKAGLVKGQKNAFKKAIVTLKEGDTYAAIQIIERYKPLRKDMHLFNIGSLDMVNKRI